MFFAGRPTLLSDKPPDYFRLLNFTAILKASQRKKRMIMTIARIIVKTTNIPEGVKVKMGEMKS